jgi:outer membrane protein OmpA-like peptidoglycan-associated protein
MVALAKRGIEQSDFAINAVQHPVEFKPERLSKAINSEDDEYWPSLSADESTFVFTRLVGSALKAHPQEDFYQSFWKDSVWTYAKNVGAPLNTYDNEGAQSLSANGMVMVYTVCNRRGVLGRCDLYISEKNGNKWTEPMNIGAPVNSAAKETQPSLSADGRTIYFASDKAGGKGGVDIWVTHQNEDGSWIVPENLGDSINTPGNEASPFIHPDNNTLYFSSDYLLGMGEYDIFYSRRNRSGKWGKSVNIGYPINTSNDEIGLIINAKGNMAYYSTTMNPGTGRDIYRFELYPKARPQEVSYFKGKVYDAVSKKMLQAGFELVNLADGQLTYKSFSDPVTGEFLLTIPTNNDYMLNVSKEGYLFYSENFSLEGIYHLEKPFTKNVPLQPIAAGKTIILKNIFFETDSYALKPESKLELNKIVEFLNKNATIKVEIGGHTDNVGSEQYNQTLSEKRAKSVVDYLISSGIAANRLVAKGYGFSKPIDTNDSGEGRANNRRTELTVIN